MLNANTANTIFVGVDVATGLTGKISAHTMAQYLFSQEVLNVGNNSIVFPSTIAQFAGNSSGYLQINMQNFDPVGSADMIITADTGTDSTSYIDMGINNSTYDQPSFSATKKLDGYLYVAGPSAAGAGGNLVIGTASALTNVLFMVGGTAANNVVGKMTANGLSLNTQSYITFADGSYQATAASPYAYSNLIFGQSNASFLRTNTVFAQSNASFAQSNTSFAQANAAFLQANTVFTQSNASFALANTAVQNTAIIQLQSLTLSGNLVANTIGTQISVDTFRSNTATFSKDLIVLGNITANTLLGNVFFSNITTTFSQSNAIQWVAQTTAPAQSSGQVWYSGNTDSLIQDTDIPGDRPALSKVLFERVYNNTGSTITGGSWVKLAGGVTSNAVPYIQLADASSAANSQVEGFIKNTIAAGGYGFVYTRGIVEGFDASTYGNNGQLLFLSTIPGQGTNVAPTGANSVVSIAKILSNGSANGKLQISIANQAAYGKTSGSILFANNNLIQASNTATIDEANGTFYVPNGILYNNRSYSGNQTTATLSFASDTWVRANIAANFAVTLTNYRAGSDIVLFITNVATGGGAAKTITHGCTALNSTVGATTFVLSGSSTARIKYYSFDGDNANTYASISFS